MINVTAITWMKNWLDELSWVLSNRSSTIMVDNITMATLIKLLAISIVANSFLGVLSRFIIRKEFIWLESFNSFLFEAVKEKKATSDPDIIAERKTKINIKKMVILSW